MEVTVESNSGTQSPTKGRAYMIKIGKWVLYVLYFRTARFSLHHSSMTILKYTNFSCVAAVPHLTIFHKGFPAHGFYIEAFQGHFKSIFKAFFSVHQLNVCPLQARDT
uniref:Uncharacterized protein n=1 Tax=Arion vulgaris TaxID=1028688 RepID=A0A0B7BJ47_9EUPU